MCSVKGRERITPPGRVPRGADLLVNIAGDMVVQDATDIELVAERISFGIVASGFGS
jgi:hypothetical protein